MRDKFLISRDQSVSKRGHDASITLSYLVKCVSYARTIPSHVVFPVSMCCCLCSSRTVCFFISTFVLGGVATSRWWKPSQLLMSSVLKQFFFVLYELRFVFTSCCVACKVCNTWSNSEALGGMQGVQHVVEFRGIGVNVHLSSVALKAYVGGSHGQCWVEWRYFLRHLMYTVSTCRWVKARSVWFESSWYQVFVARFHAEPARISVLPPSLLRRGCGPIGRASCNDRRRELQNDDKDPSQRQYQPQHFQVDPPAEPDLAEHQRPQHAP